MALNNLMKTRDGDPLGSAQSAEADFGQFVEDDDDLPAIDPSELKELYTAIGEFISVSDYDSAVDLIEALKGYSVPAEEKERRKALIKAADEIRYEDISKIIKGEESC